MNRSIKFKDKDKDNPKKIFLPVEEREPIARLELEKFRRSRSKS